MDDAVFRRSICAMGAFAGVEVSILLDELRDSHEKGPASFLGGGADAEGPGRVCAFEAGDCPQGKLGIPCDRAGAFVAGAAGEGLGVGSGATIPLEVIVLDRDLLRPDSETSPSCTSSREDVDIR